MAWSQPFTRRVFAIVRTHQHVIVVDRDWGVTVDFYLLELVANAADIVNERARFLGLLFSRLRQCAVTVHHSFPLVVNFTFQMGLWNTEQKN